MAISTAAKPMKERLVVANFLLTIPDGDHSKARLGLFRRSAEKNTYSGKWGLCSGGVEDCDATILAGAFREIWEETTLPASSLSLVRAGKPFTFDDVEIGRRWFINPFSFRIKDVSEGGKGVEGITLDWENDCIQWFDPMEVNASEEFGGIPRLVETLERVWPEYRLGFEAGRILNKGLQELHDDHELGARELAGKAIATLQDVIRELGSSRPIDERWWWDVRMTAWHLCQSRPSMGAAITGGIIRALDTTRAIYQSGSTAEDKIEQIVEALDQQLAERVSVRDRICASFTEYVQSKVLPTSAAKARLSILTMSSSSSICSSLVQAASDLGIAIDLRVLESRPRFEGVGLAAKLLQENLPESKLKVTVYSDASAAVAAYGVDLILLGADRLSAAGDVSNKIGSLPAVLSAQFVAPGSKVLVVSDTEKIAGPGSIKDHKSEENDPAELIHAWRSDLVSAGVVEDALAQESPKAAVRNAYFEWVPANFIDAYATEEGIWGKEQIHERSVWVGKEIARCFDDL